MATRTVQVGTPAPRAEVTDEIKQVLKWRRQGKRLYKKADELTEKVLKQLVATQQLVPTEYDLGNRKAKLVNNFATKNTCFRAFGIRQYEFVEVDK